MKEIDTRISILLADLARLLERVIPLRESVKCLEEVEAEYIQRLRGLNDEHDRLENRRKYLVDCLQKGPQVEQKDPSPDYTAVISRPQQVAVAPEQDNVLLAPPPPPPPDPRRARKLALADYIEAFIPADQRGIVMPTINAVLADPLRDVGDMLELIPWGRIWSERADWETVAEQEIRLQSWQTLLQGRLTYWQNRVQKLEKAGYGKFLLIKVEKPQQWASHLGMLARRQEVNNAELRRNIEVLERNWLVRQGAGASTHDE